MTLSSTQETQRTINLNMTVKQNRVAAGNGCGSVVRTVASDTRGLQVNSSHWQNLHYTNILKIRNNETETGNVF